MKSTSAEVLRYALNGVIATTIHYGVLTANITLLEYKSAGVANLVAACFGITVSFIGSRYFVFKSTAENLLEQAIKFSGLYGVIALLHGVFLWVWTDWKGLDYRIGFVGATGVQVSLSYVGNKFLVFKAPGNKSMKSSKLTRSAIVICIFAVALAIIHYMHISYFRVNVVFYAAIADGILASVITGLILFWSSYFNALGAFEKTQMIVICLIASYALAISVPTVIDRSLSFYILEKIKQRGGGIRKDAFEQVFTQEYVKEHRLVDVRLTEQLESGTVEIKNGCVLLTPKGDRLASFSRYYRKNLLPKKRLLMGGYTDDLTDPFRSGGDVESYKCNE